MRNVVYLLMLMAFSIGFYQFRFSDRYCECIAVSMLDVGQGSAMYVRTINGDEVLIDTGETHKTLREMEKLRDPLDRHIDHVFITHADRDHIGRLPELLERYEIGEVYIGGGIEDDPVSEFLRRDSVKKISLMAGDVLDIDGILFEVLWPSKTVSSNKNDRSLVMKITIGEGSILATGDITKSVEKKLIQKYDDYLQSDVLVVAHHGSKSSTSGEFLDVVQPKAALISAGEDNRYGHPHHEVLDRLHERGIEVFVTANNGTITYELSETGFVIMGK